MMSCTLVKLVVELAFEVTALICKFAGFEAITVFMTSILLPLLLDFSILYIFKLNLSPITRLATLLSCIAAGSDDNFSFYIQLQVSDEALSLLMSMGYHEYEAKRGLKMNEQDVESAINFLEEEKEKKAKKQEDNIKRQQEIRCVFNIF